MNCLPRTLVVLASTMTISGPAMAVTPPEEPARLPTDPAVPTAVSGTDEGGKAPGDARTAPATSRLTSISLTGGMDCLLSSRGQASTTWRHGRQKSGVSINETMHRVTVAGVAICAGRTVEFSAAVLVPALRVGAFTLRSEGVVSIWARADRTVARPDIAWDSSAHGAGPASLAVTIASITETAGRYEWRDGLAVDVKNFEIEGTIRGTVPCAQSIPTLRRTCRAETIAGTF
jgi:hypothetical protein